MGGLRQGLSTVSNGGLLPTGYGWGIHFWVSKGILVASYTRLPTRQRSINGLCWFANAILLEESQYPPIRLQVLALALGEMLGLLYLQGRSYRDITGGCISPGNPSYASVPNLPFLVGIEIRSPVCIPAIGFQLLDGLHFIKMPTPGVAVKHHVEFGLPVAGQVGVERLTDFLLFVKQFLVVAFLASVEIVKMMLPMFGIANFNQPQWLQPDLRKLRCEHL